MNALQLRSIFAGRLGFLGVYPSDRVRPQALKTRPQCMIVNLDPSNLPGSHWITVCLFETRAGVKVLEYFDSYGSRPPQFQTPRGWTLRYSRVPLQSALSTTCGHYCVYFTDQRLLGASFDSILRGLTSLEDPDTFVFEYVKQNYGI